MQARRGGKRFQIWGIPFRLCTCLWVLVTPAPGTDAAHPSNKYSFLSAYCVSGTILDAGDRTTNPKFMHLGHFHFRGELSHIFYDIL